MHCNLATGGPGAAMRHAPFGRPRHPLGTFPCGKVPRPPAGGRNLSQETDFLWEARKRCLCYFLFCRGFRLCGGDQGAFRSPPGPLRGPFAAKGWREKKISCGRQRKEPSLLFPVLQRVSPLRRRPKGFPLALWKPSGPSCGNGKAREKNRFLVEGKEKTFLTFSCFTEGFASAEATKGLSDRPLETFGPFNSHLPCKK